MCVGVGAVQGRPSWLGSDEEDSDLSAYWELRSGRLVRRSWTQSLGGCKPVPPSQHVGGGRQPSPPLVLECLAPEEARGLFRGSWVWERKWGSLARQAFSIVHG